MLDQTQVERLEAEAVNSAKTRQPLYAARKKIFPKRATGRFRQFKWLVMAITLGIYYLTPWLRWDRGAFAPHQAVLLDLANRRMTALSGEDVPLRAGEFELLKLFAENPNRPLSRDWLLETTSHREMEAFDRAIDIRILRIRRKIEPDPARPTSIRTVRGAGYMFVPPKD